MTFRPNYLCSNPICAEVLSEQLEARKRGADENVRMRTALQFYADRGNWYAPEGPEASAIWQGGKPWDRAAGALGSDSAQSGEVPKSG